MRAARACARAYRGEDSYFYSRWAIGVQVHRADSRSVDAAPWLQSPADSELSRESRSTVRRAHGRRVRALHVTTPQRRRWVCKHTRLPVSPCTAAVGRRRACASEPVHLRGGACVDGATHPTPGIAPVHISRSRPQRAVAAFIVRSQHSLRPRDARSIRRAARARKNLTVTADSHASCSWPDPRLGPHPAKVGF